MDNAVAIAAITLAGTICAGFFAMVNKQNVVHSKIAHGLDRLAAAHEKGNRESEQRNGHLGEQNLELGKQNLQLIKISNEISEKLDSISTQTVTEQHVENQTVEHKG